MWLDQELVDWDYNFEIDFSKSLIDTVKGTIMDLEEMDKADADFAIRQEYAYKVGRCMYLRDGQLNLFVELRLARLWNYCNSDLLRLKLEDVIEKYTDMENLKRFSHYTIDAHSIVYFIKRGGDLHQLDQILSLVTNLANLYSNSFCMSTKEFTFRSGLQIGSFFSRVVYGIRRSHLKDWPRFMRIFRYSIFISPVITGRYLKKLDDLNNRQLKMTVTDRRNWIIDDHGWYSKFRLTTKVYKVEDWQPLRKNHIVDMVWLKKFGRVPNKQSVRLLPEAVINSFSKKNFSFFVKETKNGNDEHIILAIAKLINMFGKKYRQLIPADISVHDAGIRLPETPSNDHKTFLLRYKHKWEDACIVLENWAMLKENGIDPLAKEGLRNSIKFLMEHAKYEKINHLDFSREAAKWYIPERKYPKLEEMFINAQKVTYESIPNVSISDGDFKFYRLKRDDPRGIFLGNYTNCCQHPGGAGESCAFYGMENPNSCFVVLEYRGEIKFQSWVWKKDNVLVFDNIEGQIKQELKEKAKEIYLNGCKAFKSQFGIKKIYIGCGNSDMELELPRNQNQLVPNNYSGYMDSRTVWEI